ncbi:MAG: DUF4136 domain-containing protein [Flavobacteriales bacterium]|nr:DUF4136 domain-containing protein [Flavobacteriales bacterium]
MTKPLPLLLGAALLLAGCYPDQPEDIRDFDLTYTNHSPDFDFKAAQTYALPDSVIIISGSLAEGEAPEMVQALYGDQIVARIRANMNANGWTEINVADTPDVVVLPAAVRTENIDVYYYWGGYWGWYYPWYGFGWYYPGYYPQYSAYTTGSLIIQMTVPGETSATGNNPVMWIAVFNGLLEGSTAGIADRVVSGIDQAFEQSPYLKH